MIFKGAIGNCPAVSRVNTCTYIDPGTDDDTANASYNEVRIWFGVLTQEDLERSHDLGPDAPW
jgi:hypothetical protein